MGVQCGVDYSKKRSTFLNGGSLNVEKTNFRGAHKKVIIEKFGLYDEVATRKNRKENTLKVDLNLD